MRILYVEPFEAGSHAQFTRLLTSGIEAEWTVLTLPGRHWKWRMRGAAAWFATEHAEAMRAPHDLIWASSYLPLAELKGLCPALAATPAVLYFHENQLAYPSRDAAERDHHFGFTQLISALAADVCVFNSAFNRDSFLDAGDALLARMPDAVPPDWTARVREGSRVLPVPLDLPDAWIDEQIRDDPPGPARADGPVILWNHRWEHDKGPDTFFAALERLVERGVPFRVIVCGERYDDAPPVFESARAALGERVLHWGSADDRDTYLDLLRRSHIVVSTARQEFQGVAVLEAVAAGARPLVPDRLVYPEIYSPEYRYDTDADLADRLRDLCTSWTSGSAALRPRRNDLVAPFRADGLLPRYAELLSGASSPRR